MKVVELMGTVFGLLFLGAVSSAIPQKVELGAVTQVTAQIEAIDHDARLVTLVDDDGNVESLYAGPEIQRFSELKVGDTVTFRYHEAVVSRIRKADEAAPPSASGEPNIVRGAGAKPSGSVSQQLTATVTIQTIDPTVPSVTVTTEDRRTMTFKIRDKKLIEGVKVGDHVDITYSAALVITVS